MLYIAFGIILERFTPGYGVTTVYSNVSEDPVASIFKVEDTDTANERGGTGCDGVQRKNCPKKGPFLMIVAKTHSPALHHYCLSPLHPLSMIMEGPDAAKHCKSSAKLHGVT
jgi:hypothetical protein